MKVRAKLRFKNENLFELILGRELTTLAFSKEIGISYALVCQYINFRRYPKKPEVIEKFERYFSLPIEYIFPDEYKRAVDIKLLDGVTEKVFEFRELPPWMERNLMLPSPEEEYEKVEMKEAIEESLKELTEREAKVLTLRFGLEDGNEKELDEVGNQLGVCRERIRQIEARALRKLQHPKRDKRLRTFVGLKYPEKSKPFFNNHDEATRPDKTNEELEKIRQQSEKSREREKERQGEPKRQGTLSYLRGREKKIRNLIAKRAGPISIEELMRLSGYTLKETLDSVNKLILEGTLTKVEPPLA